MILIMSKPGQAQASMNRAEQNRAEIEPKGIPLIKTLRTLLTNNIPELLPRIRIVVSSKLEATLDSVATINRKKQVLLYSTIIGSVSYSNDLAFFGEKLAQDSDFIKSAMQFIKSTLLVAEVMAPTIGKWLGARTKSRRVMHSCLIPITEERIKERIHKAQGYLVMELLPRLKPWTAERIVHELMVLWFGYATAVMKTVMAAFIRNYEMQLASPGSMRHLPWRGFIYPLPTTKVAVQPCVTVA
ncbi:hypothetical protein GQ44DRAFT_765501 [Phaeosphaeriaceae sp. PMI808]|nr:hypothetical protein GQ44DRAFT_765501 [Phaeosphaeriaceae sp. PMI808]